MSRGTAIRFIILCEAVAMGIGIGGIAWSWDKPDIWWFGCVCCLAVLFDALMTISTFEMLAEDEKRKRRGNGPEAN